jgi:tryptophan synthase alpha chain
VLELGVPWSDPSADGPAIQAAMRRALAAGGGMGAALELCRAVRADSPEVPVVLFGYANPIFVRGTAKFAAQAKQAGADGVLCVDWPPDEDPELAQALAQQGLDLVPLIAPTSTPARVKAAAAVAGGFLYYVSLTGITGSQLPNLDEASARVSQVRELSGGRLPVAVGFGIATPADARAVAGFADGVVVGSAAVRVIERAVAAGRDPVPELEAFVAALRAALS